jgi:Ca2+-binding EF-hand superfamily protein
MSYPNLTWDDITALTAFFEYVDSDHDGYISVAEIQEACAVDYNGDSVVDVDERVRAGAQWLDTYFVAEDLNDDSLLTLHELLQYNNDTK